MTTAAEVLKVAASQIGYVETPRNRTKYGRWFGINPAPWCAMFLSWCESVAGNPLHIQTSRGFASCAVGEHYYRSRGAWFPARSAQPGDLVFYGFGGGHADHVGIVEKNLGGTLITIEGNTSSASQNNGGTVRRRSRPINSRMRGVGRPVYAGAHPAPAAAHPGTPAWQRDGHQHTLLSVGWRGGGVLHMQQLMVRQGINIVPDGVFGPGTKNALLIYQRAHGLVRDGSCGPLTWASLHR